MSISVGPSGRWCVLVASLLLLVDSRAASAADTIVLPHAVNTVQIQSVLRSSIDDMLRVSPTFRSQYQRIAESQRIVVGVSIDAHLVQGSYRARSIIRRYTTGLLVVDVAVAPGPQQAEWIAHEFEHIIEQLEGKDLRALVAAHARDVWISSETMIETKRAMRAGQMVLDEMRTNRSSSDRLVE